MISNMEKSINTSTLSDVILFMHEISKLSSKKEIACILLDKLSFLLQSRFSSFVEKKGEILNVICQSGEDERIKSIFNNKLCNEIYNWVISQNQTTSLRLIQKEQFVFIPIVDLNKGSKLEHGMLVFHLSNPTFEFNKELNMIAEIMGKLGSLSMTRLSGEISSEKHMRLQEQIKTELLLSAKIQKSISGNETNKKILFSILEDEKAGFNGNIYWVSDLGDDISLVLIPQILCKGSPSAMLSGYLLGEMNSLKARAEISLKPQEVLKFLNQQLNPVFKSTGITVNAWYGVFNIGAKKVRFANANHPDPFVIGSEQQVSNLTNGVNEKSQPLGINLNSVFTETTLNIASGSKLIICTKDLLEQAAKIGDKYDPTWLPQVLETIGDLSLTEMRNSLESILSENVNGTVQSTPRLALLLEFPS